MKKIGHLMGLIIISILIIPLVILKGVGPGIKIKGNQQGGIINFPPEDKKKEIVYDENNGGGPKLKVYIDDEKKVREMYLEEYIRGVVCGEMPAEFAIEALKAQAVVARTYAVTRMKIFGGKGCKNHPDADICTDSKCCQEWISKEDRFKAWGVLNAEKYWQKITEAVDSTKGLMMTYEEMPVMYPLYFSTSSGKTENSEDYFSNPYPYLKSVISQYEESTPKFTSKVTISIDDFIKKFSQSEYNIKLDKKKVASQVRILSRTEGGSVKNIQVGSKTLTGRDIRTILGLNSANFKIEFGKNDVTITVTGNGHGVGMSQYGANGLAEHGSKFDEILKHYYQGIEIKKIEEVYISK